MTTTTQLYIRTEAKNADNAIDRIARSMQTTITNQSHFLSRAHAEDAVNAVGHLRDLRLRLAGLARMIDTWQTEVSAASAGLSGEGESGPSGSSIRTPTPERES